MSALAKLDALIWCFMSPHSHCWVPNHSICLCLLVQVTSSGSLKFHTPLKCPYKHSLTSPLLTYKISHDMWEPTSKSGASIWRFIWLLIRTIPSYLRDRNWAPWFGVSWGLTPIDECLTTPFVCACWCKSHCLGVWTFRIQGFPTLISWTCHAVSLSTVHATVHATSHATLQWK